MFTVMWIMMPFEPLASEILPLLTERLYKHAAEYWYYTESIFLNLLAEKHVCAVKGLTKFLLLKERLDYIGQHYLPTDFQRLKIWSAPICSMLRRFMARSTHLLKKKSEHGSSNLRLSKTGPKTGLNAFDYKKIFLLLILGKDITQYVWRRIRKFRDTI